MNIYNRRHDDVGLKQTEIYYPDMNREYTRNTYEERLNFFQYGSSIEA